MESTGLDLKISEIAARIKYLRDIESLSVEHMAKETGVTVEEYLDCENGRSDLNFAFLYRSSVVLGVDVTDLIEGTSPRLTSYTVTRNGEGQRIEQAHGMVYYNLASAFKRRTAEPLRVIAMYSAEAQDKPIEVTSHDGQELDIIIKGTLKVQIGTHIELLSEGDSIYYDSSTPHGMIATGGQDCMFYAIVLDPAGLGLNMPSEDEKKQSVSSELPAKRQAENVHRVWENFVVPDEDEHGILRGISFKNEEKFNFAYDVIDAIADASPDRRAIVHVSNDKKVTALTFAELSRKVARTANYFKTLGIKKGDRVMLVMKRNLQFWYCMPALHKLGAIAIPATDQLLKKDFDYRFRAAGVSTVIVTADAPTAVKAAEESMEEYDGIVNRIITNGSREGWHDFDEEMPMFRGTYARTEDSPCGSDPMLMYFTSGTSGYPKMALHNYKYPLGHFITAKYWQCVVPDGLHLTISDTGWAKAAWGKIYGQWLCEAGIFVYDFDRFDANEILPMFAEHGITTFCAPPTMYRFLIKEDLSKFDLSSITHATIAGEALNPEVFHQFKRATGLSVMEGFGQSESTVIIGNLFGMTPKVGSMGKPSPLYDVDLVDSDGNSVPDGTTGEIVIRTEPGRTCGLSVCYYEDTPHTDEAWRGGVYHTGDTAWRDEDGYFWYVGRVDDLIKSSGYRIGPFEIESVIMELPYVLECGVSAAPDEIRGQVVKASIVLTKGTEATDELKKTIQQYVKQRTAPYKYPRIVEFRDELPKTSSGKIIRNKL